MIKNINTCKSINKIYLENKNFSSFFRGYTSSLLSLSPFIALNFAIFDKLKTQDKNLIINTNFTNFLLASISGLISQTICYPLDTIRRRMIIKKNKNIKNVFNSIIRNEGFLSFYKGMTTNIIKIVPNNSIRFVTFEYLKTSINQI